MEPRVVRIRDLLFPVLLMVCGALGLAMVTRIGLKTPSAGPAPARGAASEARPPGNGAPKRDSGPLGRSPGASERRPAPGPTSTR